jgi:hypothetical protein
MGSAKTARNCRRSAESRSGHCRQLLPVMLAGGRCRSFGRQERRDEGGGKETVGPATRQVPLEAPHHQASTDSRSIGEQDVFRFHRPHSLGPTYRAKAKSGSRELGLARGVVIGEADRALGGLARSRSGPWIHATDLFHLHGAGEAEFLQNLSKLRCKAVRRVSRDCDREV